MKYLWSRLNRGQLGRYAEYYVKMEFVLHGCDVYSAEVDCRGIDFIIRTPANRHFDIQVKSSCKGSYVFFPKHNFKPRGNLLAAVVLFQEGGQPGLYLIPSTVWKNPNALYVDRNYEGKKSKPEYGLILSGKNRPSLGKYSFDKTVLKIMQKSIASNVAGDATCQ